MARTLVTPSRTIYSIEDKKHLKAFAEACQPKIDSKQEGNLRQLLGFDPTANGSPRHEADDYFCLEDDRESWLLQQSSGMLFPLFGSAPAKLAWLKKWATVDMSVSSFKRLIAKPGNSKDGWECCRRPAAISALPDGASLFHLSSAPGADNSTAPATAATHGLADDGAHVATAFQGSSSTDGSLEVRS